MIGGYITVLIFIIVTESIQEVHWEGGVRFYAWGISEVPPPPPSLPPSPHLDSPIPAQLPKGIIQAGRGSANVQVNAMVYPEVSPLTSGQV